jgi:hypothetical protein
MLIIISNFAQAQAIRGVRAKSLTQRNACCAASEIVLPFASIEPGHCVREKNLHADAMVGSDPFPGFWVSDGEQLRFSDQVVADGASPTGHREWLSLAWDCSDFASASLRELIGNA